LLPVRPWWDGGDPYHDHVAGLTLTFPFDSYFFVERLFTSVTVTIGIPDTVHEQANKIANEKDMSIKEAVRYMCNEPRDFDV
jgi:hypothetical protein